MPASWQRRNVFWICSGVKYWRKCRLKKTDRCEPPPNGLAPQIRRDSEYLPSRICGNSSAALATAGRAAVVAARIPLFFRKPRLLSDIDVTFAIL